MGATSQSLLAMVGIAAPESPSMAKEDKSDMTTIAKKQLQGRGYLVSLSTSRDGENLIGKLRVSEAGTQRTVANLVSVWKVDDLQLVFGLDAGEGIAKDFVTQRSEEHTSELQSRENLVCRLLLEKKKI